MSLCEPRPSKGARERRNTLRHADSGRPSLQIGCDRLADVMGQRHRPFLAAFAMHPQPALRPVDILQLEAARFPARAARAVQAAARWPDCAAPPACAMFCSRPEVGERIQPASLLGSTPSTIQQRWDRRGQVDLDVVAVAREAEERAQRGHYVLRRGERPLPRRVAPDIVGDVRAPYGREPKSLGPLVLVRNRLTTRRNSYRSSRSRGRAPAAGKPGIPAISGRPRMSRPERDASRSRTPLA